MHERIVSVALLCQSSPLSYSFSSIWTTFPLTKVGPPIFEWAVPRPFVHLRVEIMVLLSMNSDRIFERMILNSYA